jgi:hypothetical protein
MQPGTFNKLKDTALTQCSWAHLLALRYAPMRYVMYTLQQLAAVAGLAPFIEWQSVSTLIILSRCALRRLGPSCVPVALHEVLSC